MYLNDFSVRIPEGLEIPGGYVEVQHCQRYRLVLGNRHSVRCDARVEIDGKHVGTWRIEPNGSITLERPVHDTGHFTFYQVGTKEAMQAALDSNDPNLGLVKVTFTPEKRQEWVAPTNTYWIRSDQPWEYVLQYSSENPRGIKEITSCYAMMNSGPTSRAGGTGLSGTSNQKFSDASCIVYDYTQQTVIHLRLIANNENEGPRPLTSFSTQVPPRIY